MDDKARVLRLYEKMNKIKLKTSSLIESVELFEDDLNKYIQINNKAYKSGKVASQKSKLKEVKRSIKYDVMSNLRNYL